MAYFDNARFWLILLVVCGHFMGFLKDTNGLAQGVYLFIYSFHMPAFVLISGYLSRNFTMTVRSARRTFESLVVPLILFEVASQLLLRHYTGSPSEVNPLETAWLGWFLWALVVWRALTPFLLSLRHPLLVSILISLASPFVGLPELLAAPKVLSLLPFYTAGLLLAEEDFRRLATARLRWLGGALLFVALVVALVIPSVPSTTLLWKRAYDDPALHAGQWVGLLVRMGLILLAFLLTAAFLALVSWRPSLTTPMGARTLYCYLLHGFVLLFLVYSCNLLSWWPTGLLGVGAGLALAGALGLLLLTRPVEWLFRPVLQPSLPWLFKS